MCWIRWPLRPQVPCWRYVSPPRAAGPAPKTRYIAVMPAATTARSSTPSRCAAGTPPNAPGEHPVNHARHPAPPALKPYFSKSVRWMFPKRLPHSPSPSGHQTSSPPTGGRCSAPPIRFLVFHVFRRRRHSSHTAHLVPTITAPLIVHITIYTRSRQSRTPAAPRNTCPPPPVPVKRRSAVNPPRNTAHLLINTAE